MTAAILQTQNLAPCLVSNGEPQETDVQGITLSLPAGSVSGVVGPVGSYVSEWLRCVAGISAPCSGRVMLSGVDLFSLDKPAWQRMRTKIAYLDRHTRLLSVLPMLENIVQPALYHKMGNREALQSQALQLLDEMGLQDREMLNLLPAYIDQLSYVRALLARAFLLQPEIIMLDDFFQRYNKKDSAGLLQFILIKAQQQSVAVVLNHADLELVLESCQRICFVSPQLITLFDSASDLMSSSHEEVKAFLLDQDSN